MATVTPRRTSDEVLVEVRRIKEELAAVYDFDVHRIAEEARRQQAMSGRRILAPPPKDGDKKFDVDAAKTLSKNSELYQHLA